MFELNKRYHLVSPVGQISQTGIALIQGHIQSQGIREGEWLALNPETHHRHLIRLPDEDWRWEWVITGRGDYVGTFPKRVSKYYWKRYGLKCPASFLSEIGNIAKQHSEDQTEYWFDFVREFDWIDGDYGDRGSCYWGGNSGAREMLWDNGGYAIRFYEDGRGFGRAWLVKIDDNQYIVFNGYGYTTLVIARVFAQFTGLSYKRVDLTNHGEETGLLYINGGSGQLVGSPDAIEEVEEYDFEWGDAWRCEYCSDAISEDTRYITPDDEYVCESCFYEHCDYCSRCGETEWNSNTWINHSRDEIYCNRCDRQYCTPCDECHNHYEHEDIKIVAERNLCYNCVPEDNED